MRLGWWRREAGQPLEAVKTYRGLLAAYPRTGEAPWVRAGLVPALLDLDDYAAAREVARRLPSLLQSGDKTGPLSRPPPPLPAPYAGGHNPPAEAARVHTD